MSDDITNLNKQYQTLKKLLKTTKKLKKIYKKMRKNIKHVLNNNCDPNNTTNIAKQSDQLIKDSLFNLISSKNEPLDVPLDVPQSTSKKINETLTDVPRTMMKTWIDPNLIRQMQNDNQIKNSETQSIRSKITHTKKIENVPLHILNDCKFVNNYLEAMNQLSSQQSLLINDLNLNQSK